MFHSLRSRLVLSYAGLALLSVVVAVGASLFLFGRSLDAGAHREMIATANRLVATLETLAEARHPAEVRLGLGSLRRRGPPMGQVLLVDRQGRPVGDAHMAPPEFLAGMFPPGSTAEDAEPAIRQTTLPSGQRVSYVSVAVPRAVAASPETGDLWLTVVRPAQEVRGLWRVMVRPVLGVGSIAVLLASLLALALARGITRPIEDLTRASERMAKGDYTVRVATGRDDEIGRLATTFNAMSQEIGEAHRRQKDFVANVSHDLRTPLTAIRGFAGALVDGTAATPAQQRQAAAAIDSAAARMESLVNILIDMARLEGHTSGLTTEPVPVGEVLEAVAAAHAYGPDDRGIRVAIDARDDLVVAVDPDWLLRALGNVVDNALRYSPADGEVRLAAAPAADDTVVITVEDDGPGIPPEDLPRVFERFYRGDKARLAGGSGLGLSIAHDIVAEHGGDIAITSVPGQGTRVSVRLPRAAADVGRSAARPV